MVGLKAAEDQLLFLDLDLSAQVQKKLYLERKWQWKQAALG